MHRSLIVALLILSAGCCYNPHPRAAIVPHCQGACVEVLTITGTSPAVHIGRVPTVTLAVQ